MRLSGMSNKLRGESYGQGANSKMTDLELGVEKIIQQSLSKSQEKAGLNLQQSNSRPNIQDNQQAAKVSSGNQHEQPAA